MKKQFFLSARQLRRLATGHGGCIATDMITVEGRKVGRAATTHTLRWRSETIMGFAFYYQSTEAVDSRKRAAIDADCRRLCEGRTWLSCEPVHFGDVDGHMWGGSKPNYMPHPDDAADAALQGLPDGTVQDALNILCQLSRDHGVDWEITHDEADGPIGFIRNGQADYEVVTQLEQFASLVDVLEEYREEFWQDLVDEEEDDGPSMRPPGPEEN